ncbi:repetitive proline-rich cell wall protein 2-like [Neltuma alba]|uniref:repetitive proline-rich cell wall protein 2-like n=1 Tax=Neltuma alba TaxID=207710 RepID=UPI0010A4E10B|nr:repetitive proline-rich cell wall protein 2-like [Prosopis alba]XP_028798877.1 repetitive proline-rich cell wall protein 2-like [Prosopis alba]
MSSKHFLVFLLGVAFLTTTSSFANYCKPPVEKLLFENIPSFEDSSTDESLLNDHTFDIQPVEEPPVKNALPIFKTATGKPSVYKSSEKPLVYKPHIMKESIKIKSNKPPLPPPISPSPPIEIPI